MAEKTAKELFEDACVKFDLFRDDAGKFTEKGNKAAGVRARKASKELERIFKEFRKVSAGEKGGLGF